MLSCEGVIAAGVRVELRESITYFRGEEIDYVLVAGLHGIVSNIDNSGDACITFDGMVGDKWVLKKSMHKLRNLEPDAPGSYQILHDGAVLSDGTSTKSTAIGSVGEGTIVDIVKVVVLRDEDRVRGRVKSPNGWISLLWISQGYRWADRVPKGSSSGDRPGSYRLAYDVAVREDVSPSSAQVAELEIGTMVEVLEVAMLPDQDYVRAQISKPVGWISLVDTKNGIRWAHQEGLLWRYEPLKDVALLLRANSSMESPFARPTAELKPGEAFKVDSIVIEDDHERVRHLRLADGRGWAFDWSQAHGTMCVPVRRKDWSYGVGDGTVLQVERTPCPVFESTSSRVALSLKNRGDEVVARGHVEEVMGCKMVPIRPTGAVDCICLALLAKSSGRSGEAAEPQCQPQLGGAPPALYALAHPEAVERALALAKRIDGSPRKDPVRINDSPPEIPRASPRASPGAQRRGHWVKPQRHGEPCD